MNNPGRNQFVQDKASKQYLARYAEKEVASLPAVQQYQHCLVIPAYDESWAELQQTWQHLPGRFLVILVVNSPTDHHLATLQLLEEANTHGELLASSPAYQYRQAAQDLLVINRCGEGLTIDPDQGVGLARKIGADIALKLIADGNVESPIIYCSDADAILPADYFSQSMSANDAALIFPFNHQHDGEQQLASQLYEFSILYYAAGLAWAGSHYAYTTLGSAMAVNANHYARVRGFPVRNATEDFYLLNKLAKTGQIVQAASRPIQLSNRLSDRVPVGTGPGISKIMQLGDPLNETLFYNPEIFRLLQELLSALAQAWQQPELIKNTDHRIKHFIESTGFYQLIEQQRQSQQSERVFHKFVQDWFDGFRTLKFVHFMREHYLPSLPFQKILTATFLQLPDDQIAPDAQLQLRQQLRILRNSGSW